jgi:hypothetical protein
MTVDMYVRLGFGLLAAVLLIKPLRALASGRYNVRSGGTVVRGDDGSRFWVEAGCEIAFLSIFLAVALFWPAGQRGLFSLGWPIMAGAFGTVVIRGLLTGSADSGASRIDRDDRPGAYWLWIAGCAALSGMAAFVATADLLR